MIPVSERIPYQPGMAGGTWKSQRSTVIRCCGFERAAFDGRRLASPHSRRWRRSAPAPAPGPWCRRSGIGATVQLIEVGGDCLGAPFFAALALPVLIECLGGGSVFGLCHATSKRSRPRDANYQSLGAGTALEPPAVAGVEKSARETVRISGARRFTPGGFFVAAAVGADRPATDARVGS